MTPVPLYEQPAVRQRRWFLLGAMCLSLVLVVMSVSSLNVAIPTLQRDLGASASQLQWIVDSYALVFAGLLLSAGAIGDRFGRREALLGGLAIFAVGALVGGFGDSANQVIVGRTIQGIGAAFVMPATLSLVTVVFPPEERRQAIAIWVGFAGAGGAIGQVVSGALLETFWWGSAILCTVPVVALVAIAVALFSPESRDDSATPLDPVGALLSLVGLGALLFGIIEGPERGWGNGVVLGAFAVAAIVLAGFVGWEHRTTHPMLPMSFFRDRRFSVGSGVITLAFFSMFGFWFMFSQYLQFARGYSPLLAGVAVLPMTFVIIAVSPRSAAIAARRGSGPTIATGFLIMGAGFGVLALVAATSPYVVLFVALVLLAAGMSITVAPATGGIMSSIPMTKAGVGSAVNDTTREVGGALGVAVLGSIVNAVYRGQIDLAGIDVPPGAATAAEDSVGAAHTVAGQVGGDAGDQILSRAAHAFSDAFNTASTVSVLLSLGAAAVVATVFSRRKERAAVAAFESKPPASLPEDLPAPGPDRAARPTTPTAGPVVSDQIP